MVKYDSIFIEELNKKIRLEIYIPDNKVKCDVLYMLDGENCFRDSHTKYGRSLRLEPLLDYFNNKHKLMIVGIYGGADRTDLYSPFKIINSKSNELINNDTNSCLALSRGIINQLIPYIDNKYSTNRGYNHRFIYGSSLGANLALYLGLSYKKSFSYIGAFSTASFIYGDEFIDMLKKSTTKDNSIFLYVGMKESSDDEFNSEDYLNSAYLIYDLIKDKCNSRLMINKIGTHSEKSWSTYIADYLSFIYKRQLN